MTWPQEQVRIKKAKTTRIDSHLKGGSPARWPSVLGDVSGAFADLGTFIPLVTGMLLFGNFDPARVLVGFGIFGIVTGAFYRRPVPVQPMKAVAALAITGSVESDIVTESGLLIGITLIVLALCGLIEWIQSLIPRTVLQGVQLGLGASFIFAAARMPNSKLWIVAALLALLIAVQPTVLKSLSSIALVACGLIIAIVVGGHTVPATDFALPSLTIKLPTWADFAQASYRAVLPQLALTLTNAVLLTASISADYFPHSRERITARNLALSSGALNAVLAPFGAIPMCHGAGGLAAQCGQGARTGLAPVIFGSACLSLAVMANPTAVEWLMLIPGEVVAALLAFAGVQLMSLQKLVGKPTGTLTIIIGTATIALATNVAVGLIVGLVIERLRSAFRY